jgi:DNA-binding response OmpR family regulator
LYRENEEAGLRAARAWRPDMIVTDYDMPRMTGFELVHALKQDPGTRDIPVMMLTARDTRRDQAQMRAIGLTAYLVKPFSLKEVGARLGALIKRYRGQVATMDLLFADVRLDLSTMTVERAGHPVKLPPKCLQLLRILLQSPARMFTRAELESEVWGEELPDSDTLRTHIYTLRRALSEQGEADLVETIHGVGYRLVAPDQDAK